MRLPFYAALLSLVTSTGVIAQVTKSATSFLYTRGANSGITANNGEMPAHFNAAYRFPEFIDGVIVFRNGEHVAAKLNYDVALDELISMNDNSITAIVANPETIAYAEIGESRFYFVKGKYVQTIETKAGLMLAYSQDMNVIASRDYKAYSNLDQLNPPTINITELLKADNGKTSFSRNGFALSVNVSKTFYLGDKYGNFIKANEKNLIKYFESNAPAIAQYVDEHAINFNKLVDVKNVLNFCATLN